MVRSRRLNSEGTIKTRKYGEKRPVKNSQCLPRKAINPKCFTCTVDPKLCKGDCKDDDS